MNNISNIDVFYQFTNKIMGLSFNLTRINGYKTALYCYRPNDENVSHQYSLSKVLKIVCVISSYPFIEVGLVKTETFLLSANNISFSLGFVLKNNIGI